MSDLAHRLDAFERVPLAGLPTPVNDAPRLAKHAGLSRLLIKRDDRTGLALGGNKARKLEYDLAEAVREKADVLLTVGGTQSNHAAMTSAAARRLGLEAKLVLGGPDFERFDGNLLLDVLFGAEIRYLVDDDDSDSLAGAMEAWTGELRAAGRRPFAITLGGSTGRGALGYVRAMREIAAQIGYGPVQIVAAVGSCGTLAGLNLGARCFLPNARVIGISVSRKAPAIAERTAALVRDAAELLEMETPMTAAGIECHDDFAGDYGVPTAAGLAAIDDAARLEGLVLDPVYTGKAMSGLVALARRGALDPNVPVLFLHSGGLPITFAFERVFRERAVCTKIRR